MGYIAPVTPYDWIQYANRTVAATRKKKAVHAVKFTPAIQFHLYEESGEEGYVQGQWGNVSEKRRRLAHGSQAYQKQRESKAIEEAKAKITGKGLNINEVI
jgi:hypothetical protein